MLPQLRLLPMYLFECRSMHRIAKYQEKFGGYLPAGSLSMLLGERYGHTRQIGDAGLEFALGFRPVMAAGEVAAERVLYRAAVQFISP